MALSNAEAVQLARSVEVRSRPDLSDELLRRQSAAADRVPVGVTDLIDLRPAYWRRVHPVPFSPEQQARLERGRTLHAEFARAVARPDHREVRVERDGIVGRIDLWESDPTEVKSTDAVVPAGRLVADRPQYVEQLAMYCALTDRPRGRLVFLVPSVAGDASAPPGVAAADLEFGALAPIWREMQERARRLRSAWDAHDPTDLPRCPWYGRGCELQAAGVCDCTGLEPPTPGVIGEQVTRAEDRPDAAAGFRRALGELRSGGPDGSPLTFRELLYPRRAYFEWLRPEERPPSPPPDPGREDRRRSAWNALHAGPSGELSRRPSHAPFPMEMVDCFRDGPVLLRSSRSGRPPGTEELPRDQPQYFLELGFRAAAVDHPTAYLVVDYERLPAAEDPLRVYEIRFQDLELLSRWGRERAAALRSAKARHDPMGLPPCPGWMVDRCPYRSDCRCGGSAPAGAGRLQR